MGQKCNNEKYNGFGVSGKIVNLPCFFPSISSIKTNLSPLEYLKVIIACNYPLFLISAYDIHFARETEQQQIKEMLILARKKGQIVLFDSGNYESYWRQDKSWKQRCYHSVLKEFEHDLAFSFDFFIRDTSTSKEIEDNILLQIARDQRSSSGTILPLVHAQKSQFSEVILSIANKIDPLFIAIPERQLGEGIFERAQTICEIDKVLKTEKVNCPIHLLGTGNPLSMLIYTACGASCYDGLEWCQTTVDHDTGLLYHFQQRELFVRQTKFNDLADIPYAQKTLGHNLDFFNKWIGEMREYYACGRLDEMFKKYLPSEICEKFNKTFLKDKI